MEQSTGSGVSLRAISGLLVSLISNCGDKSELGVADSEADKFGGTESSFTGNIAKGYLLLNFDVNFDCLLFNKAGSSFFYRLQKLISELTYFLAKCRKFDRPHRPTQVQ